MTKLAATRNSYQSFILALWREGDAFRCRLENPRTGERIGFADVDTLAKFLEQQANSIEEGNMADSNQMQAQLLAEGEGEILSLYGVTLNLKTTNTQSGGEWFTMVYTAPPNFTGPPSHVNKLMTEIFYVVEGTLTVRVGDETRALGAGGYAFVPPGTQHQFSNPSDAPVKFFGLASPNFLEPYMNEMRELLSKEPQWPPQDMSKLIALMAKYDTYT